MALITAGFRQFELSTDGHIHVMLDETKPTPFIGIEREPAYFEASCARLRETLAAPKLFADVPEPAAVQEAML